ncbi:hypothetical protein CK910_22795 [Aeromonas sp. CA23]|uniref:fimbrial biogenesis chaperone n=1 Tax=Aeromonas sp. CA23 TaxID=2033032 RepID=UPI000BFCEF88|nr:molecular chaperone [Aeromonas sp. CA23]ATM00991.1 hypothetical protein CK910_22795 [Aeromonas sp. CA23]
MARYVVFALLMTFGLDALASGLEMSSSRIVIKSSDRERSLQLKNSYDYPLVIQSWVDEGHISGSPELAVNSPMIVLPAMFRLNAGELKTLRLVSTGMSLAKDREEVRWLNIYALAPKEQGTDADTNHNKLNVTVRLQMKAFFRPATLTEQPSERTTHLSFYDCIDSKKQHSMVMRNDSPYFISFSHFQFESEIKGVNPKDRAIEMLPPYESRTIALSSDEAAQYSKIRYRWLNDDGSGLIEVKDILHQCPKH